MSSAKNERACMICGIVQPFRTFVSIGCPNCESLVTQRGDDNAVLDCTSPAFEGLVSVSDGKESWVARWLRVDKYVPGIYAVKINGKLPADMVSALAEKGVTYRPRDGSAQD